MKNFKTLQLAIISFFLLAISCEEDRDFNTNETTTGILSFQSILNQFGDPATKAFSGGEIPHCKSSSPAYVRVALKYLDQDTQQWEWFRNSNEDKIEIAVNPNGTDTNNDGEPDSWFTKESLDLELEAGTYSLEYFTVTDGHGDDAEILYMAPRSPDNVLDDEQQPFLFHNFVEQPLPIQINIGSGVKYYQSIEVLCYDENYAFNYGFLFFDFTSEDLKHLCVYGNYCLPNGRQIPAQFSIKVWKGDKYDDANLLISAENELRSFTAEDGSAQYYTDAICFPLPDLEIYSARIWQRANGEEDILIREGIFSSLDLDLLFNADNEFSYYHFREGCCENADNIPLLEDILYNPAECEEEPEDPPTQDCSFCDTNNSNDGKVQEIKLKYSGLENIVLTVTYIGGPNNFTAITEKEIAPGEEITITGAYNQSSQGLIVGNNLNFLIENNPDEDIHTSCSQPLYIGLKTNLDSGTNNGNFSITSLKMSTGEYCPQPPE